MNGTQVPEGSQATLQSIERLLEKQMSLIEGWIRPYIIVDVRPRGFINMLYFRIRNVGQTPAQGIQVGIEPPIEFGDRSLADLAIFQHPIASLGPNDELTFFLNSAIEIFNQGPGRQFRATVTYKDAMGRKYSEQTQIDVEILRGLALKLPSEDDANHHMERIEKSLERIEKIEKSLDKIEKIANYLDNLSTREIRKGPQEPRDSGPLEIQDLPRQKG